MERLIGIVSFLFLFSCKATYAGPQDHSGGCLHNFGVKNEAADWFFLLVIVVTAAITYWIARRK